MKKLIFLTLMIFTLSSIVYADNEITQFADKLNYWNSDVHTVYVSNNGNVSTQVNITISGSFTWNTGTCGNPVVGLIVCDLLPNQTLYYRVNSNSIDPEYTLTTFSPVTDNSYTGNSVSFLRIREDEIFHTLVEFGRGRGNYFFDTYGGGVYSGSGHTGTGCNYLPNDSVFELNFLHKVLNIRQYFGLAGSDAENATFTCTYPDNSVVRDHLSSSIQKSGGFWTVKYLMDYIGSSWERMAYLGMDFDAGEFTVSQNVSVNCSDLVYTLADASGNISLDGHYFDLEVRDREPFSVTASTNTVDVGNGTQEVLITYVITNNEIYTADNVIIDIEAPQYAMFIGTVGELWGVARDQYRIEKINLAAGESEVIKLIARFDTSNALNTNSLDLSQGVKVNFITCWEANAYNPNEYTQNLDFDGYNVTLNMSKNTSVIDIPDILININITVGDINGTVTVINNTVNDIWNLSVEINGTVTQINTTVNNVWNYTQLIYNDTQTIIDLLNCNNTTDTPICDMLIDINKTIVEVNGTVYNINYTINEMNGSIYQWFNYTWWLINNTNYSIGNISIDIGNLTIDLNCSNPNNVYEGSICWYLFRIKNVTEYINESRWGNFTAGDIYIKINETYNLIEERTTLILEEITRLREFNEELVFLVTDSFGLQESSKKDLESGNFASATTKLSQAEQKLNEAAMTLIEVRNDVGVENINSVDNADYSWAIYVLFGIILVGILAAYLLSLPGSRKKK